MKPSCTRIAGDVFDVARRLKELDRDYFVVYCRKKRRFEVHNSRQKGDSLCLVVPYCRLDARTVALVRQTKISRLKQVLEQMERDNLRADKQAADKMLKQTEISLDAVLSGKNPF